MTDHPIVSHEDWIAARKAFLKKEKDFTRLRDEISRERQALPWERVEKVYAFDGPGGTETLADLFDGRSQLLVYHFMFDTDWDEGCKSCSLLADHYERAVVHLNARDVSLVTVSRAPLDTLEAFKRRMGWTFKWVSSGGSDFNRDYNVTFTPEELAANDAYYNYTKTTFPATEGPGISVFYKDAEGGIFHTYSSYGRGLDMFITAYHLLDIVPKGRDEADLSYGMEWVRLRDQYDHASPPARAAAG